MFLQKVIRLILIGCIYLLPGLTFGQVDSVNIIKSPYKKEKIEYFEFGVFQRGYPPDSLKMVLDHLESRRKDVWSRTDSLNFAQATLRTGNAELASYYFSYLSPTFRYEKEFWWDHMMTYVVRNKNRSALEKLNNDHQGILEFSEVFFLKKILIGKVSHEKDNKWYKTNSVLKWDFDTTLTKGSEKFELEILEPIKKLDRVLKRLIHLIHENDPIISRTCYELSFVMERYLSLSQTYVIMSLARHYNKRDKAILNDIKRIKSQILKQKYKIPNFRKYFPRIEFWRFDYEMLKEKARKNKEDVNLIKPDFTKEVEKRELPIDPDTIIFAGIAFVFLMVLVLIRTRKR